MARRANPQTTEEGKRANPQTKTSKNRCVTKTLPCRQTKQ